MSLINYAPGTAFSPQNAYGSGGSAGSQFRKQESGYARALRILDRQARRGDANSALKAIGVREQANDQGYSPGGVRNKAEADAGILGRINQMERGVAARNQAIGYTGQVAADASAANPDAGVTAQNMDFDAGFTGPPKPTRVGAALDILEGGQTYDQTGDPNQIQTGIQTAQSLGVQNPTGILQGDSRLKYRQTLDQALGAAKSPQEIDILRQRGERFGVPVESFNRRAKWWETNRI
jgi:hypothetical protein